MEIVKLREALHDQKLGQPESSVAQGITSILNDTETVDYVSTETDIIDSPSFAPIQALQLTKALEEKLISVKNDTAKMRLKRSEFLELQFCLFKNQNTGRGIAHISPYPLYISYNKGCIISLLIRCLQNITELDQYNNDLESMRIEIWKSYSEKELIDELSSLIKNKTKCLKGIVAVLEKAPKEQLIEKLRAQVGPLLKREKRNYTGEGLFHYLLKTWPEDGKKELPITFTIQEKPNKPPKEVLSIPDLIGRSQHLVKTLTIKKKN